MICKYCRQAGDANKSVNEISLADMWRKQERYRAIQLHMLCKDAGCFCQHRVDRLVVGAKRA